MTASISESLTKALQLEDKVLINVEINYNKRTESINKVIKGIQNHSNGGIDKI